MSRKTNNLVKIAQTLIELKEERDYHDIPVSISSRYPEGSMGIIIDEDKYIVLNSSSSDVVSASDRFNELKDTSLKYNPNFYISTHESDEPDIIDDTHNKSKLINQAYTEVSFLPKDIYSQAEFDPEEGKAALKSIIDRSKLSPFDFDDYRVEKPSYQSGNVYDEIYRCRCIFHDITGNESVESLLIKAYKVSNIKDSEYSYHVVNSDNIVEYIEKLESLDSDDETSEIRSSYSKISATEYENIEKHIKEGIEKYYEVNSKRYYRLTRVDVKAIYCLRLKKIPVELNLLVDNAVVAKMSTFYSMVSSDLNVYTCPNCNTLSNKGLTYDEMKIHVDHDFTNIDEDMLGVRVHIGCNTCMERCNRCGRWHFKLTDYANVVSKGFTPINRRAFLKNYANLDVSTEGFCRCKENLTWVYDEMSQVKRNNKTYFSHVIDKFLTSACKLTFVNYLTGESIATYQNYIQFLYVYLGRYLKNNPKIYDMFSFSKLEELDYKDKLKEISNFLDVYIMNEDHMFDDFMFSNYIAQSLQDFKKCIAAAFNLPQELIKTTNMNKCSVCVSCQGKYYTPANEAGEHYYNSVKNLCFCCDEANNHDYRTWIRSDDGVVFYKSKTMNHAIRTFQSNQGEENFELWIERFLEQQTQILKKH